jgi:hypothetical protein
MSFWNFDKSPGTWMSRSLVDFPRFLGTPSLASAASWGKTESKAVGWQKLQEEHSCGHV